MGDSAHFASYEFATKKVLDHKRGYRTLSNLAPLLGKFLGVELKPIQFKSDGMQRSVSIPGVLDEAVKGVGATEDAREPMHLDNTLHPANSRLALGKATQVR